MIEGLQETDIKCNVCFEPIGNSGTCITASAFGTIGFCFECWSFIYQAIYDDLQGSGQIKQEDEE